MRFITYKKDTSYNLILIHLKYKLASQLSIMTDIPTITTHSSPPKPT